MTSLQTKLAKRTTRKIDIVSLLMRGSLGVLLAVSLLVIFLIVFSSVAMVCMLPPTADIPPPKILGEISNKELYNFIVNRTVWYGLNTNLFIGDYKYKLTSVSEIRRFLRKEKLSEISSFEIIGKLIR